MLSPADFITLSYTPDMTPAGIALACQTLTHSYDRNPLTNFQRLRQVVAEQAAELAFRRHLSRIHLPHKLNQDSSFASPSRVSAVIGGRKCCLYNTEIYQRRMIRQIRQDPAILLSSPAVAPAEDLFLDSRSETDLLIFSFVTGLITPNHSELEKAAAAGQSFYMLYPLPAAWSKPSHWAPLGNIGLKAEVGENLTVLLGGLAGNRTMIVEEIKLPALRRVQSQVDFYSLAYAHLSEIPSGRLGLHCPALDKPLIIKPYQWGNIWVYGMNIILAGWITRGEFLKCASACQPKSDVLRPAQGHGKYLALPVSDLKPLESLFEKAFLWSSNCQ
jgi:hypothetical protein